MLSTGRSDGFSEPENIYIWSVNRTQMATIKKATPKPMPIRGKNASGKIITAYIPAGKQSAEDPGLAIQELLQKYPGIRPTPID